MKHEQKDILGRDPTRGDNPYDRINKLVKGITRKPATRAARELQSRYARGSRGMGLRHHLEIVLRELSPNEPDVVIQYRASGFKFGKDNGSDDRSPI